MELIEFTANIRKSTGKGISRALRRQGLIPAVLYGPKMEPLILSVDSKDIEKFLKQSGSSQAPLNLAIKNGETIKKIAMIKDIQLHPVSRKYLHVDLYEVDMDKKIQVKVPVVLTGKAKGAEAGGTLQLIRREIDVLCLPLDIPESITIDVSEMEIGDSIHVEELPVAEHLEILADTNFTVVTVSSAMAEAKPEEEEEEFEEEGEVSEEEGTEEE
ncbi:MAG: 50S ribosomal protein L25/general stress protein Ctc [Desulfobacterales bacterium]